jgi:hypothetical protein
MPARGHINTLEKPPDTSTSSPGQTTKNDGLPYGKRISSGSVPAGWQGNTIEKTAGQTEVCRTRKAQAEACVTGDGRFFITVRGLGA